MEIGREDELVGWRERDQLRCFNVEAGKSQEVTKHKIKQLKCWKQSMLPAAPGAYLSVVPNCYSC